MSQTPATPQITGKMFLFERPELLNKETHGELGFHKIDKPHSFCANIRAVPLTINEFPFALRHYPIVFANNENPMPLAVLGVIDDINLFVEEDGEWADQVYIPSYIRRYPFATATESTGDRLAIVIDAASGVLTPGGEIPLFEGGELSKASEDAIEFCKRCEGERRLTETMMAKLKEFDLIRAQSAQYTQPGAEQGSTFAQYFGIDEKRLTELPADQFEALRQAGLLPYIYAQLLSFSNWRELMNRRARRFNLKEEALFQPLAVN